MAVYDFSGGSKRHFPENQHDPLPVEYVFAF